MHSFETYLETLSLGEIFVSYKLNVYKSYCYLNIVKKVVDKKIIDGRISMTGEAGAVYNSIAGSVAAFGM